MSETSGVVDFRVASDADIEKTMASAREEKSKMSCLFRQTTRQKMAGTRLRTWREDVGIEVVDDLTTLRGQRLLSDCKRGVVDKHPAIHTDIREYSI